MRLKKEAWSFRKKWDVIPLEGKASIAYVVCNILQRSLSFITLPIFTRLLTPQQYGQSTIYYSWSSLFTIFITLMLYGGSFSTAMIKYNTRRDQYIASVEGISLVMAFVFILIYFPFRDFWNRILELSTYLVFLMVVEILANFAFACWQGKCRFEYKYKRVIAVTLLMSVLSPLAAFVLVIGMTEKGIARITGYAIITIIFGSILFIRSILRERTLYNAEFWRYAFGFNIPLIPYYLSQMIYNQSDRVMINHYCGQDKAGIYGVAYSLAIVLGFVLTAINNSYQPWLFVKLKEKKTKENHRIANGIAILMSVLLLGIIIFAPEIITIIAGNAYREAIWVVPPVAMSQLLLFYAQLPVNLEFYYEEKKWLVYGTIGAAIVNIILNALLIPRCDFVAAGYTTLMSYALLAGMHFVIGWKIAKKHELPDCTYNIKTLLLILLAFLTTGFFSVFLYERPLIRYFLIVAVMTGAVLNYKKIYRFFKIVNFKHK